MQAHTDYEGQTLHPKWNPKRLPKITLFAANEAALEQEHIHIAVMDYDAARGPAFFPPALPPACASAPEPPRTPADVLTCLLPHPCASQTSPDDPIGNGVIAVKDLLEAAKGNNGAATFDLELMFAGLMKGKLTGTLQARAAGGRGRRSARRLASLGSAVTRR